jgi:hypothetical protein
MRKLLVVLFFVTILFSCKNNENEYKNNLIQFKNLIEDINTYFIDSKLDSLQISHYYTEDFVFHSYPAGHKKGVKTSKVDYINNFNQKKNMNMSINITHSIYLPGINEESHDIDGSIRVYYGATISNDTIDVEFSGYQTINFSEGKISGIWEWADYGGVSNQFTK